MVNAGTHAWLAAESSGVSPALSTTGIVISILASVATVLTVFIMFHQTQTTQKQRDEEAKERQEARIKEYQQLRVDFYGEHRDGVPPTPGVLEWMKDTNLVLQKVLHEMTPNGGGSMKDAVNRIEADLKSVHERLDGNGKVEVNVHP